MCKNKASYRFTWSGYNESFICEECVFQLKTLAKVIGLPLQVISLTKEQLEKGHSCNQKL